MPDVSETAGGGRPAPGAPPVTAVAGPAIGAWPAAALVFGSSAAVLVVEIVALRLLAPYLGLTLETSTLVIGLALAAIALGSWIGGRWADERDPRGMVGALLGISGAVVAVTPFLLRGAGSAAGGSLLLLVAAATIIVPGLLLSAVTPIVTKLRLASLAETGSVVGRLSGIGTAGAILGTVLTGFVLISRVPVTWIMVGLGILLVAAGLVVEVGSRRRAGILGGRRCGRRRAGGRRRPERVRRRDGLPLRRRGSGPGRDSGRRLVLDNLWHSYVDLEDPRYLEFSYVKALAAAVDARFPVGQPIGRTTWGVVG